MLILDYLLTGSLQHLSVACSHTLSGIDKTAHQGPVKLGFEGFETDFQGDTLNHGGPEKAIHHYPFEHYALWGPLVKDASGNTERLQKVGGFGENFSTHHMTEQTVSIGDVFQIGTAIIEVSQSRQPCWKLAVKFNIHSMATLVQKTGMTGWYYRVLQAGQVQAGDQFTLVERRSPTWTIERLNQILFSRTLDALLLKDVIALPALAMNWKSLAQKRLDTQQVEDWTRRLNVPEAD